MKKLFKVIIPIVILIVIFGGWYYFSQTREVSGGQGTQLLTEGKLVSWTAQNAASFSTDTGDDTIIVEGDPGATYTSLSVGDVIFVDNTGAELPSDFLVDTPYFVITASLSDRFEVSTAPYGTVLDLTASSGGTNNFYESPVATTFNVEELKYAAISIDAEEAPSLSFYVIGSIMKTTDWDNSWYASRSRGNRLEYVDTIDIQTQTSVDGSTGYTLTGTDTHRILEIYPKGLSLISLYIKNYASGSFDAYIRGK